MNAPEKKAKAQFVWDDPLLLESQLTAEERLIRDSARAYAQEKLMPRILQANRREEFDRAIESYNEVIRLRPDDVGAIYDRGEADELARRMQVQQFVHEVGRPIDGREPGLEQRPDLVGAHVRPDADQVVVVERRLTDLRLATLVAADGAAVDPGDRHRRARPNDTRPREAVPRANTRMISAYSSTSSVASASEWARMPWRNFSLSTGR